MQGHQPNHRATFLVQNHNQMGVGLNQKPLEVSHRLITKACDRESQRGFPVLGERGFRFDSGENALKRSRDHDGKPLVRGQEDRANAFRGEANQRLR